MKFPTGSRQNKWINDYVAPIMISGDFEKAIKNYKENKRFSLREDMRKAGVYDSLKKLEEEGTSWDKVYNPMVETVMKDFNQHQIGFAYGVDFRVKQTEWEKKSEEMRERMEAYRKLHPHNECYNVAAASPRDRMSALLRIHTSELGPIHESNLPVYRPRELEKK